MIAQRILGTTKVLAAPENWDTVKDGKCHGLAIRATNNGTHMIMESAWEPTPKELEVLNAGGVVVLSIFGNRHPPVRISVETNGRKVPEDV